MNKEMTKNLIENGQAVLGIEFGSTRIKAVLIDDKKNPIASGAHDWENRLEDGIWTYSLDDIWTGVQDCYQNLVKDVAEQYGAKLTKIAAMGFSGMMHGYMAFDAEGTLMVPFRTWRNTITGEAAAKLSELFQYNIPQRWSIAHLYQAILNGEEHVGKITHFTTLAGYIHWMLTGKKVMGVGEASGMFPIDIATGDFDADMVAKFDALVAEKNFPWTLKEILPEVLPAGAEAGFLTEAGAKLLDPTGELQAGVPMCPPEGDAGTGMTATNSVRVRTGNVSAGTSIFAMVVLEEDLKDYYEELDLVTTPAGDLVAMVHCNNCTSDLNAWVNLFEESLTLFGEKPDRNELYGRLYRKALEGDPDCGGLLAYNYYSGEPVTGFDEGRPLFVRQPDAKFNLANFMRVHLLTSMGALKVGLDILLKEEGVKVEEMMGHGGLFKTKEVGQRFMAAAIDTPVTVMETAGEGGAWGMALLAAYLIEKDGLSLDNWLAEKVFATSEGSTIAPVAEEVEGFDRFLTSYKNGLDIEHAAVKWTV